ncbi:MAG TPA: sodium:proton antiporter [Thioploca sp.]|nr:MAG: hypothetical protein B6247_31770 [Beggiatoa sp. 4572_84]RKZ50196.1 MAG: sodium:proton antiporter [Gammaproteobacteria bacterium]HDN27898.1 sodium:proton antiporter [Thioploca sp.]
MSSSVLKFTLLVLLLSLFEVGLVIAVFFMPDPIIDISELAYTHLSNTNVTHPVTALLVNYRSYDTLLGMAVLLLALLGVWTVYHTTVPQQETHFHPDSPLMQPLPRWILAILVLTVGYVLWAGVYTPGGAFIQVGAVLAGTGALFKLSPFMLPQPKAGFLLRLALSGGLLVFVSIALALMVEGHHLLKYPPKWANELILLIEISLIVSVGLTLVMLFIATPGVSWNKRLSKKL